MEQHDDPLWTVADIAAYLGIVEGCWRGYVARTRAGNGGPHPVPMPTDMVIINGLGRPAWRRSAIVGWNTSRKDGND